MKTLIFSLIFFLASLTSAKAYLTVSPGSMEFGSVKIGNQVQQMFFINNIGNEDAQIFSCSVFGAFYCQLNCFGTLPRGQTCSGTIYFSPDVEGHAFETVLINTNRNILSLNVHGSGKL